MDNWKQHPLFDKLLNDTADVLDRIYTHPFNEELADGTLPPSSFSKFLIQDSFYLSSYAEAMQVVTDRLQGSHKESFQTFVTETKELQNCVHNTFVPQYCSNSFKVDQVANSDQTDQVANSVLWTQEANSVCLAYTRHLLTAAKQGTIEESVVSLFPCFYVYHELGCKGASKLQTSNPYYSWISGYTNYPSFTQSVERFMQILVDVSTKEDQKETEAAVQRMSLAFLQSCEHEWNFIQDVYACHYPFRVTVLSPTDSHSTDSQCTSSDSLSSSPNSTA